MKSSEVSIKTRSTPALLTIQGQVTKDTTVKLSITIRREEKRAKLIMYTLSLFFITETVNYTGLQIVTLVVLKQLVLLVLLPTEQVLFFCFSGERDVALRARPRSPEKRKKNNACSARYWCHDLTFSSFHFMPPTMENEVHHKIPFSDVINNSGSHSPVTSVYGKKTFTGLLTKIIFLLCSILINWALLGLYWIEPTRLIIPG